MIRRHISAAHICLRCQIRLGQRSLQFSARRAYSTELIVDHEGNWSGASNGQPQHGERHGNSNEDTGSYNERWVDPTRPREWPPEPHNDKAIRKPSRAIRTPKSSRRSKPLDKYKPKEKVYGHTGLKQFGASVPLSGVDALGKSAEVLVLRDSKLRFYKEKVKDMDEAPAPESIDILARVQSERGIISSEDLETNINEFKPQKDKIQTWEDFNDVVQSLHTSFTNNQLKKYIQSYPRKQRMRRVPSLGLGILYDKEAISRCTPWVPEISPINQPIDNSPLRGYSPASYNPKQNHAVRVLRECWQLEVPEIVEGIGEVEIQIAIKDLDFLVSQGYIESVIKRYYLNEPERIEIFRPRQALRITSTREKSAFILAEIQDGIKSISREKFPLGVLCLPHYKRGWESRTLTPRVLTKLGELTKTDIRRLSHEEPSLLISSMVTDQTSKLSQRFDVVRRLLLDLVRPDGNDYGSRKVGLRNFDESSHEVDLPSGFVRFPRSRELSWHEKLRTWSRWITATPKSTDEKQLPEKVQYKFPFKTEGVNLLGAHQKNSASGGAESLWSHEYVPTTWIKAGTILHNISSQRIGRELDEDKKTSRGHGTISPDKTLNMNKLETEMHNGSTRTFSSQVPNISGLFQSDQIHHVSSDQPNHELIVYFKPNPWALCPKGKQIGPSAFRDFPQIEMSFAIDPKLRKVNFREIHAIVSTETADLMLPELKADLQFERKIRSTMLYEKSIVDAGLGKLKEAATAVKNFVNNSQLDLTSQRQLETPPKLVLPLARHLCTADGWKRMADKPELGVNVEYLVTRLEYRKTAFFNFAGHELRCTSIEAGKAGGSRLELSLACRPMPNQKEINKTMQVALRMIDLMDMKNITKVYGQIREVFLERKDPVLGPDDFKFVPKRPSDFLTVQKHYPLEEEKEARFGGPLASQEDDEWGNSGQKPWEHPGEKSFHFEGTG
ncbi:hypothetical protein NHQ30_007772 [Ciborinia camelliae]|nr:hypothetical protein NHQ30_007772 [Ciborinia camelliae]